MLVECDHIAQQISICPAANEGMRLGEPDSADIGDPHRADADRQCRTIGGQQVLRGRRNELQTSVQLCCRYRCRIESADGAAVSDTNAGQRAEHRPVLESAAEQIGVELAGIGCGPHGVLGTVRIDGAHPGEDIGGCGGGGRAGAGHGQRSRYDPQVGADPVADRREAGEIGAFAHGEIGQPDRSRNRIQQSPNPIRGGDGGHAVDHVIVEGIGRRFGGGPSEQGEGLSPPPAPSGGPGGGALHGPVEITALHVHRTDRAQQRGGLTVAIGRRKYRIGQFRILPHGGRQYGMWGDLDDGGVAAGQCCFYRSIKFHCAAQVVDPVRAIRCRLFDDRAGPRGGEQRYPRRVGGDRAQSRGEFVGQ